MRGWPHPSTDCAAVPAAIFMSVSVADEGAGEDRCEFATVLSHQMCDGFPARERAACD